MFTGIIETMGQIRAIEDLGGGKRFTIETTLAPALKIDQSVACNGVCLTVVAQDETTFSVEAIEETLRKTTLGTWQQGQWLNLERAMRLDTRLDGHIVQGHVDTTAVVETMTPEGTGWLFSIRFDPSQRSLLIPRGSIAVDGTSLTIAQLAEDRFTIAIIPYTFQHTVIGTWQVGTPVNLEFDMLGKYVIGWLEQSRGHGKGL